jgi:Co/Zn/Cd efflux system component
MHVISGVRDPSVSFPLAAAVDDRDERHRANRAVAVSAAGLAVTGLVELVIALVSGSVALLSDALHNLSDVRWVPGLPQGRDAALSVRL